MYSEDDFFYDSVLDIPFSARMSVVQIGILEVSESFFINIWSNNSCYDKAYFDGVKNCSSYELSTQKCYIPILKHEIVQIQITLI